MFGVLAFVIGLVYLLFNWVSKKPSSQPSSSSLLSLAYLSSLYAFQILAIYSFSSEISVVLLF
jgi:hypothetical protein